MKKTCKESEIKLSLLSFDAVSRGDGKLGKKYSQPIVAQLFGEARRHIEVARGTFNEK